MSNRNRHINKPVRKNTNTLVDVCILTVERTDLFEKCLDAAIQYTGNINCAYYVLNNGGPREKQVEYDRILSKYPQVSYTRIGQNEGFPGGANNVIKQGFSPLVLFLSDDIILHDGAIEALVKRMDDFSVGLAGLKLLFPLDNLSDPIRPAGKVQHVGHAINIHGDIIHPCIGWDADNPKCCQSREMTSMTGAAFMVRRTAFVRAGGFVENYGKGYYEDVDLCYTLRSMGYKIWLDADAVAEHFVGATLAQRGETIGAQQNKPLFMARHGQELVWDEWKYW